MITILGPTATGKTSLAAHAALKLNAEIISADSRQVYKRMDIGTGKDYEDYRIGNISIPYHLIDIVEPGYEFSVYEYQKEFRKAYDGIISRGKLPILCGGSGLYIEAVLRSYDLRDVPVNEKLRKKLKTKPDKELIEMLETLGPLHNKTDITDRERLIRAIEIRRYYAEQSKKISSPPVADQLVFGISLDRSKVRESITRRLRERLENGMIEEVQGLLDSGLKPQRLLFYGLEYKYITRFLIGELRYDEMFLLLNTAIHQYAKRQMTWFRRMEKHGIKIHWIDGNVPLEKKVAFIIKKTGIE